MHSAGTLFPLLRTYEVISSCSFPGDYAPYTAIWVHSYAAHVTMSDGVLGGNEWTNSELWGSNESFCSWHGVSCVANSSGEALVSRL